MSRGHRGRQAAGGWSWAVGARAWAPTLACAAALGLLLAATSTSLSYLLASPTSDPYFGPLNHCLASALPGPRLGWAVAPDGSRAAAYEPHRVAVCGPQGTPAVLAAPGVVAATFDGQGTLWVAAGGQLWREQAGQLLPLGDLTPVALAGLVEGVLALDPQGQLLVISSHGQVQARAELPGLGPLWVGPGGELAVVLLGGELLALDTRSLTPVHAGAPCAVEALWWLEADQLLLSCGPQRTLTLSLRTGQHQEAAASRTYASAWRLGARPLYVQDCDGLPCSAPAP